MQDLKKYAEEVKERLAGYKCDIIEEKEGVDVRCVAESPRGTTQLQIFLSQSEDLVNVLRKDIYQVNIEKVRNTVKMAFPDKGDIRHLIIGEADVLEIEVVGKDVRRRAPSLIGKLRYYNII